MQILFESQLFVIISLTTPPQAPQFHPYRSRVWSEWVTLSSYFSKTAASTISTGCSRALTESATRLRQDPGDT